MNSPTVDHRRCQCCTRIFPRSRWMVRRGTSVCASCQRGRRTNPDFMREIGRKGHEAQRIARVEALEPKLAGLSKVACYQLGREDEANRIRASVKRQEPA